MERGEKRRGDAIREEEMNEEKVKEEIEGVERKTYKEK